MIREPNRAAAFLKERERVKLYCAKKFSERDTPQMRRAKDALARGRLQKTPGGFRDAAGNLHNFAVIAALARRNIVQIENGEARPL